MHGTWASRDHEIQQSSSTGLPIGLQAYVQSVTRAPRLHGLKWACNSASYNNAMSHGLNSMQCTVTRAQRAPRAENAF